MYFGRLITFHLASVFTVGFGPRSCKLIILIIIKKKNILDELKVVLIIAALSCNMLDLLTIKLTTIPECYPIGEPCVFINTRNCNSPPGL